MGYKIYCWLNTLSSHRPVHFLSTERRVVTLPGQLCSMLSPATQGGIKGQSELVAKDKPSRIGHSVKEAEDRLANKTE